MGIASGLARVVLVMVLPTDPSTLARPPPEGPGRVGRDGTQGKAAPARRCTEGRLPLPLWQRRSWDVTKGPRVAPDRGGYDSGGLAVQRVARVVVGVAVLSMALAMLPAVAVQAVRVPETLSHRGSATAGPVVPGFAIDHLGVLFDDRGNGEVQAAHGAVRFRHDGTWGDWIPLTKDDASGKGLWASALVAGDGAEAFQVRGIPAGAGSPRTVAFNTSDGPLRTTGARTGGASAINNCMSRAEWGADESLRMRPGDTDYEPVPFSDAQVMTLHHTATSNLDDNPAGTVRAIYEYHTVDNGWQDIGYHYLISEDGTVFEGRWSGELGDTYDLDGINPDTYSQRCDEGGTGADFATSPPTRTRSWSAAPTSGVTTPATWVSP